MHRGPGSQVELRFGAGRICTAAPPGFRLERLAAFAERTPALDQEQIRDALRGAGLARAARNAARIAILVPDGTRVARVDAYLPALADVLREAEVPGERVEVVFATGTHPPAGDPPCPDGLPPARRHDCRDPATLTSVGVTRSGNEVHLARSVAQADLVILTGRITNHYFAGFTGGAKALLPGVAGYETILRNHRRTLDGRGHPDRRAANGRVHDNPVRQEMEQALDLIGRPAFLLDTIVDDEGAVRDLCVGAPAAFADACARADVRCRVPVRVPFDVVAAGCGGAPADGSFMQALKAPCNFWPAVRPGGVLVWVADCGTSRLERFERWLSITNLEALREEVVRDYDLFGHNAVFLREIATERTLVLVSQLPAERVKRLGLHPAPDLAAAFRIAEDRVGRAARCLVVEHANNRYAALPG